MSSQAKVTADKKTPKKAVGGKKEVEGDSLKKIETKIVELNENTVELDELEQELDIITKEIRSWKGKQTLSQEVNKQLASLQTKYTDGREFQANCSTIILSAQENEFT